MDMTGELPAEHRNLSKSSWLIDTTNLPPGGSAILGNNFVAFYVIHITALLIIFISLVSSFIVIMSIVSKLCSSSSKLGFSTRLPLYLAVADLLWSLSHFTDHLYLVVYQVFPSSDYMRLGFGIYLAVFFGYQQLMQTCVAVYTYTGVVHGKKFNLGKLEWKLHFFCFFVLAIIVIPFSLVNSFGNSGYWISHDANTTGGKVLAVFATTTVTFTAICVTFSYVGVRRTVINSNANLRAFASASRRKDSQAISTNGVHTTATQCLTTFVWVAACIYCPHALILWTGLFIHMASDAAEPITCVLIVIVTNSSGWANAYAYFRNERLKCRRNSEAHNLPSFPTSSTDTKSTHFGSVDLKM